MNLGLINRTASYSCSTTMLRGWLAAGVAASLLSVAGCAGAADGASEDVESSGSAESIEEETGIAREALDVPATEDAGATGEPPAASDAGQPDEADGGLKAVTQFCVMIYRPVCGADGRSYPNTCFASRRGATVAHEGPCAR